MINITFSNTLSILCLGILIFWQAVVLEKSQIKKPAFSGFLWAFPGPLMLELFWNTLLFDIQAINTLYQLVT